MTLNAAALLKSGIQRIGSTPIRFTRPLATIRLDGHFQVTKTSTIGWYVLGEARWPYRSVTEHEALLESVAFAEAGLAGKAFKLRATTRPYDAAAWAVDYANRAPKPIPGPDFPSYVNAQYDRINGAGLVDSLVALGVRLGDRVKDLSKVAETEATVRSALQTPGLDARPMTSPEMEWLMHRSLGPGLPLPGLSPLTAGTWDPEDLAVFDTVTCEYLPGDRMVKLATVINGERHETWVSALTIGRMERRLFPEDGSSPWLAAAAEVQFPVEVVVSGTFETGLNLRGGADLSRVRGLDNLKHYQDRGDEPPESLVESVEHARTVSSEMASGRPIDANRVICIGRIVVTGDTREEVLERQRVVTAKYGTEQRIDVLSERDQASAVRELVPGEPWENQAHQRQLPIRLFAAAVPNVTGKVGTDQGPFIGYTSGRVPGRPVFHDLWYPMEELNKGGVIPFIGDMGCGKTGAILRLLYDTTIAGIDSFAIDPSGDQRFLCQLPDIKDRARLIDIGSVQPGTLAVNRVISMPDRDKFGSEDEYQAARGVVESTRKSVMVDVFSTFLPNPLRVKEDTEGALSDAVAAAEGDPWMVIEKLRANGYTRIAGHIADAARGYARAMFPDPTDPHAVIDDGLTSATLVVAVLDGITVPDTTARAEWNEEERIAAAMLHLTALFGRRFVDLRPAGTRKLMAFDEGHWLARFPAMVSWIRGLNRMLRRNNTAFVVGTQHPVDVHRLDPEGKAFQGGGYIGRQEDPATATASLELFALPTDSGYQTEIAQLCKVKGQKKPVGGEFIHIDCFGRADRMRWDQKTFEGLEWAQNSTPGARGEFPGVDR